MAKPIRCAVYTRKSTEDGLEQAFNSLDAQREACAAYVASQKHEGWKLVPTAYDDGGFSGGNMDRPGLRQLIADVEAGKVDVIVVYKVDRLTRSLADFAKIVEVLDAKGASFVSVTQSFNTTTSMGRLTLNVLLSFAQFEREVTGERIRDKIAASKAKGIWMGGPVPLGYRVEARKLLIDEGDAATVRHIFQRYVTLGNGSSLIEELRRGDYRTKLRPMTDGTVRGGVPFGKGTLFALLTNPIYIGQLRHNGKLSDGEHDALIDRQLWDQVQALLGRNRIERKRGDNLREPSLLAGIIRDGHGRRMSPSHACKGATRYRYYITHGAEMVEGGPEPYRLPAHDLEAAAVQRVRELLLDRAAIAGLVASVDRSATAMADALSAAAKLAGKLDIACSRRSLIGALVRQVRVEADRVAIAIDTAALLRALDIADTPSNLPNLMIVAPAVRVRRRKDVKLLVTANDGSATKQDDGIIALLREARDTQQLVLAAPYRSIRSLAEEHRRCSTRMGKLLRLAWLAPAIIETIVAGEHPVRLTPRRLLDAELPLCWDAQRRLLTSL